MMGEAHPEHAGEVAGREDIADQTNLLALKAQLRWHESVASKRVSSCRRRGARARGEDHQGHL